MFTMLDGNAAAVEAMKLACIDVFAAYPITPQSSILKKLSELAAKGELSARYIRAESEHAALSIVLAAQLTGVRAATATSSNGLALMHEVLGMASGNRQPIVMPVVNRAVAAPWSLGCEHGDAMSQRDMGWLQFYCQNVQEVLDLILLAYRVAEDARVLLPAMVCFDGFFLSHSTQKADVPEPAPVQAFLGKYQPKSLCLDPENPMFVCGLTGPDEYTEIRYQHHTAMKSALHVTQKAMSEFETRFGRKLSVAEGYRTQDADAALVALGSMCGTAKYVVDALRAEGKKVGLAALSVFRPFPSEWIRTLLGHVKTIGVFDRSCGLGSDGGPLWNDVRSALYGCGANVPNFIGGLGGRDVSAQTLRRVYDALLRGGPADQWADLREDAMFIREVEIRHV